MIKRKQLNTYLEKRFSGMQTHLNQFSSSGEQEELHLFRVNVKKVKAVINLLDSSRVKDKYRPLRKIFKQAGKIRTMHIEMLLAKHYSLKDEHYFKAQRQQIMLLSVAFGKEIKQHSVILKKVKKKLLEKSGKIRNAEIKLYVKKQLEALNDYFSSNKDKKVYHQARMVLKNLLYVYDLFPEKLKEKLSLDKNYLDELQDTIGKWHDAAITLNHMPQTSTVRNVKSEVLKRREGALFQAMTSLTENFNTRCFLKLNT